LRKGFEYNQVPEINFQYSYANPYLDSILNKNITMQIEPHIENQQVHIFSEEDIIQYVDATTGQRFLNYLIDRLFMRYGIGIVTGKLVEQLFLSISPETAYKLFGGNNSTLYIFLASVLVLLFTGIFYYTICEKAFRGYTLGKLITGTRAVRLDGKELSFKDALLRTLCRIVPFEVLSGFGTPWHDNWTKTRVIKSR